MVRASPASNRRAVKNISLVLRLVAEAEPGGRHGEFGSLLADADVAADRQRHPAADAIAVDLGDRRLRKLLQGGERLAGHARVLSDRLFRRAFALKLRDVGARDERFSPRARQDDEPDRIVLHVRVEQFRDPAPHVQRDGVALFRVVEDDMADAAVDMAEDLVGAHALFLPAYALAHGETRSARGQTTPVSRKAAISSAL